MVRCYVKCDTCLFDMLADKNEELKLRVKKSLNKNDYSWTSRIINISFMFIIYLFVKIDSIYIYFA